MIRSEERVGERVSECVDGGGLVWINNDSLYSDALLEMIRLEDRIGSTGGGGGAGDACRADAGAKGADGAPVTAAVRLFFFFGGARRRRWRGMMLLLYSFCFLPKL